MHLYFTDVHIKSLFILFLIRPSSQAIEINQFVERCFRESRAIDMESLCIIAGEKVM